MPFELVNEQTLVVFCIVVKINIKKERNVVFYAVSYVKIIPRSSELESWCCCLILVDLVLCTSSPVLCWLGAVAVLQWDYLHTGPN